MTNATPSGNGNGVSKSQESAPDGSRRRSIPHPRYTLRQAEELARQAFKLGATRRIQDDVAQKVGYTGVKNGAFRGLRATANQFGLIEYEGDDYLSVSNRWINAFHTEDDNSEQLIQARQEAILLPDLYKQLIDQYKDHQLPKLEKLARELYLNPKYGILQDASETAARVFLESIDYAGMIDSNRNLKVATSQGNGETLAEKIKELPLEEETRTNQASSQQPNASNWTSSQVSKSRTNTTPETNPSELEGLDRHEFTLANHRKVYLYVPVPLPAGEKERLKKYLSLITDFILEEPQPPSPQRTTQGEKDYWQ